jgi:hypothetical protein
MGRRAGTDRRIQVGTSQVSLQRIREMLAFILFMSYQTPYERIWLQL